MAGETVKVWQCIGCGRIEAPQECVGICEFKRIDMVYAFEHEKSLEAARERCAKFEELARYLARITPREGEWERSWKALQARARALVAEAEATGGEPPAAA